MYLETIDEKAFRSFLSNPAISVLDGNVLEDAGVPVQATLLGK